MLVRMERMEARIEEISHESSLKDERINMLFMEMHRKLERSMHSINTNSNLQLDKNAMQSASLVNQIPSHRDHKEKEREKPLTDRVKISQTTNNPFQNRCSNNSNYDNNNNYSMIRKDDYVNESKSIQKNTTNNKNNLIINPSAKKNIKYKQNKNESMYQSQN